MGAEERREEDTIEEGDEWLMCAVQRRLGRGRGSCYMQYRERCGKGRMVDTADEEATSQHVQFHSSLPKHKPTATLNLSPKWRLRLTRNHY